jgi:NADH-quinone oxidoreductase subunit H
VNNASVGPILLVALIKVAVLLFALLTAVAYLVWFERKVAAHLQGRWGPYRVGPHGLLQPLADGVKFLLKEDATPASIDRFAYFVAPMITLTLAITAIAMIPFGPASISILGVTTPLVVANINVGLLAIFAITSIGVYGVALAGWSSNSKYSLLGGLRSSAQMVSYELSLTLSIVGILLLAGTFNLNELIMHQSGFTWGALPQWNLFNPTFPQVLGLIAYFIAAIAETNRAPFDLAEAESEIVAGYHTEYSSFKFAMFFMGEYASMITVACLASILFLGGWLSPFPQTAEFQWTHYIPAAALAIGGMALIISGVRYNTIIGRIELAVLGFVLVGISFLCSQAGVIEYIQGPFWFLAKVLVVLFVYVWVRWTLPRFRYDQLMRFGWKVLFPVALANVVFTSLAVVIRK